MEPMPKTKPPIKLHDKTKNISAYNYLKKRHIADEIIEAHAITGTWRFNGKTVPAVGFPYRTGDTINAVKWRSADDEKQFSQENVCEDFFNLDSYVKGNDILICEGEVDALAWMSCELPENLTVMSIPNGAPAKVKDGSFDPKHDKKFSYIWKAKQQLESANRIILNTDDDTAGHALQKEIIRRVTSPNVWTLTLDGYKDASEALSECGTGYLEGCLEYAEMLPTVGLHDASVYEDAIQNLYENGEMKGASTGIPSLDTLMQVPLGMLTVVTGVPSSGKSDLIDQVCLNLAKEKGWKTVYCSFEKPPELHIAQLSQKIIDKPFFTGPTDRMSEGERDHAVNWINDHFIFMDHRREGPNTIDKILEVASAAVMRMGCRCLVIDPYNYLELDQTNRETDNISSMLTKVQQWAKSHEAHVFFIAHPTKIHQDRRSNNKVVVTGHDIAGSFAWFAKADIGLTVWRHPTDEEPPEAHVWKVRWNWIGKHGHTALHFDKVTTRWEDMSPEVDDFDWNI
jgi:twinkle protein